MTPPELVEQATQAVEPSRRPITEAQLHLEEALASSGRLWIRGRFVDASALFPEPGKEHWWVPWRKKAESTAPPEKIRLETRIGGHLLASEAILQPDGTFETCCQGDLPPARRGWRIARNRITWGDLTAEKCCVVLSPRDDIRRVALVILPWACTSQVHGAQRLATSDFASRATPLLRQLSESRDGPHAFYYLARTPADPRAADLTPLAGQSEHAELGLAATTLGWPSGNFVLLGHSGSDVQNSLHALDRLRWLFAKSLELVVVNLESALAEVLPPEVVPKEDRAAVRQLINSGEESTSAFNGSRQTAPSRAVSTLRPTRSGLVPRHPVVFCHGMLAFTTLHMELREDLNYFSPLREFLRERGFRALFPQVTPTGRVSARAKQLRAQILHWTDEPINIVAHSMGGLDARHLITHLGMSDRVRSLTTIATPHQGTYLVDWFLRNFGQRVPLLLALEAMGLDLDGFRDCLPSRCRDFNSCTADSPSVRYFSYGGSVPSSRVTPVLRRAWSLLHAVEGPNDGLVSARSARWGEYLGTLAVDHFAQTPDMTFVRPGEDFDALGFYFRLLEDLARRGF
jgi:triacylglycerol lipase